MKKLLLIILFSILAIHGFAEEGEAVSLTEKASSALKVECIGDDCSIYIKILNDSLTRDPSVASIQESFRFLLQDERLEYLKYELEESLGKVTQINATIALKQSIGEVFIYAAADVKELQLERSLPFLAGDFDNLGNCQAGESALKETLENRGYSSSEVQCERTKTKTGFINYVFRVKVGETQLIKKVYVVGELDALGEERLKRLRSLEDTIWDRVQARLLIDELNQEFIENGFFDSKIEIAKVDEISDREVHLGFKMETGLSRRFAFHGNNSVKRLEFKQAVQSSAKQGFNPHDLAAYQALFKNLYTQKAYLDAKVEIRKVTGQTKNGIPYINFYVDIHEGKKAEIGTVSFSGNDLFTDEELKQTFYKEGTNLIKSNFLDKEYFEKFKEVVKEKYLAQGFLFIDIPSVEAIYNAKTERYDIEVRVNEKQQVMLTAIEVSGLDEELTQKVLSQLTNKPGTPLDLLTMDSDINNALSIVREQGYLFARVNVKNERDLLNYSSNFTEAVLTIPFVTEEKVYLDSILVTGNRTTKSNVILRETKIASGEVVTPELLQSMRDRLTVLGLFSDVRVQTYVLNRSRAKQDGRYIANLLIQVKERDYGILEIAPGYRTDLGLKLGAGITKNNIFGRDHSLTARAEGNYRLNHSSFDERRRQEGKDLLEYEAKVNYRIPYVWEGVFSNGLTFDVSTSFQLKRFYGFDAYISRVAPQLSYNFSKRWSAGLRYQFEHIDQFDATEVKDDDNFTIGGLTPSISYDLRDNPTNPRSGALFSLSWEFANPAFGSMSNEDITINFSKLIQRNRFYIPINRDWYIASSISWGYQKNFADDLKRDANGNIIRDSNGRPERKGYIPSLKVFRLDGIDLVRGYADNEINRLEDEDVDIGDVIIDETAYFANIKLEPRYQVDENVVIGVFFDAGRVFRKHFSPLSLRTSMGTSLKLVTPVGSLDFDYGVKLHRNTYDQDKRESFGRFHLTIGFF